MIIIINFENCTPQYTRILWLCFRRTHAETKLRDVKKLSDAEFLKLIKPMIGRVMEG